MFQRIDCIAVCVVAPEIISAANLKTWHNSECEIAFFPAIFYFEYCSAQLGHPINSINLRSIPIF